MPPLNERDIRRIVQEEIKRDAKSSRFGYQQTPLHTHNGSDSRRIREIDLDRNPSVSGNVEFATETTYTFDINMPFTPRQVTVFGTVFNNNAISPTVRAMTFGVAALGKAYYLQPDTATSVAVGDIEYPAPTPQPDGTTPSVPLQSSTYMWVDTAAVDFGSSDASGMCRAGSSEDHVVSISFGGTIYARVTVVEFSKDKIVFSVPFLESGFTVIANYLIT